MAEEQRKGKPVGEAAEVAPGRKRNHRSGEGERKVVRAKKCKEK